MLSFSKNIFGTQSKKIRKSQTRLRGYLFRNVFVNFVLIGRNDYATTL